MRLYNTWNGLVLFGLIFTIYVVEIMYRCSCKTRAKSNCVRHEFYGVQLNHFVLFFFLGVTFPSYFYTLQIVGILFEILEGIMDYNDAFVMKYVGGCLAERPKELTDESLAYTIVYKNEEKYRNPIDRLFGIRNSQVHAWHGSAGEVVMNFLGFVSGYAINKCML